MQLIEQSQILWLLYIQSACGLSHYWSRWLYKVFSAPFSEPVLGLSQGAIASDWSIVTQLYHDWFIDPLLHSSTIVLIVFNEPKITYAGKVIKKTHTMHLLIIIITTNNIKNNNMQAERSQHTNCLKTGKVTRGPFHEAVSLATRTVYYLPKVST